MTPAAGFRRPRGEYKLLSERRRKFEDGAVEVTTAFFTETNQFMITTPELADRNVGYEIVNGRDVDLVRIAVNADLENRVKYLYTLLDEMGFRIYAVFVLGIISSKGFQAFDIYAGVAGQGSFLPLDQVHMLLEQINVQETER